MKPVKSVFSFYDPNYWILLPQRKRTKPSQTNSLNSKSYLLLRHFVCDRIFFLLWRRMQWFLLSKPVSRTVNTDCSVSLFVTAKSFLTNEECRILAEDTNKLCYFLAFLRNRRDDTRDSRHAQSSFFNDSVAANMKICYILKRNIEHVASSMNEIRK